jgi:hypothetical protein
MAYLGVGNIAAPFPIYINLVNDTSENETYYNQTTFFCDEPVISRYQNATACGCLVNYFFKNDILKFKNRNFYLGLSKIM